MSVRNGPNSELSDLEKLICNQIFIRPQLYDENHVFFVSRNDDRLKYFEDIGETIKLIYPHINLNDTAIQKKYRTLRDSYTRVDKKIKEGQRVEDLNNHSKSIFYNLNFLETHVRHKPNTLRNDKINNLVNYTSVKREYPTENTSDSHLMINNKDNNGIQSTCNSGTDSVKNKKIHIQDEIIVLDDENDNNEPQNLVNPIKFPAYQLHPIISASRSTVSLFDRNSTEIEFLNTGCTSKPHKFTDNRFRSTSQTESTGSTSISSSFETITNTLESGMSSSVATNVTSALSVSQNDEEVLIVDDILQTQETSLTLDTTDRSTTVNNTDLLASPPSSSAARDIANIISSKIINTGDSVIAKDPEAENILQRLRQSVETADQNANLKEKATALKDSISHIPDAKQDFALQLIINTCRKYINNNKK